MNAETLAVVLARCETPEELDVWDAAFSLALALPRAERDALRAARTQTRDRLLHRPSPAEAPRPYFREEITSCRVFTPRRHDPPHGGCFGDGQPRCEGCAHFER